MSCKGEQENSWWRCAAWFSKSWPYFRPKNVIFHTCFQTRLALKSVPIFRLGLKPEIMSSFLRLECQQKFLQMHFKFTYFFFVLIYLKLEQQLHSYTCQLSHLRRESHACGLKTSISRRLMLAGQFLTPDWKMWIVAVLLNTISKNVLTQTHVRNENHV